MHILQTPLTIMETLSKAPGNPVLWHLFLTELAGAMQCDRGFLSIADLGHGGGFHYLYHYNMAPQQPYGCERNLGRADCFDVSVAKNPYRVFCSHLSDTTFCAADGCTDVGGRGDNCRFGVSFPLNKRYTYCLHLSGSRVAADVDLQVCAQRLQTLVPVLQNVLQKEQWLSLYNQITLLTGKHVDAYIIVDSSLKVLFSDPVFNRIIMDMDCVKLRGKRLVFLNESTEQRVLASMTGSGCDTVTMQNHCASFDITVIPARALDNLYAWEFYKKGIALAFINGHENSPTLVRLMTLYNLTKCEALCALDFIATPSVADIAVNSHRSTETVRNHLKSIMHKLDVHSQGALMKKLLSIAAL